MPGTANCATVTVPSSSALSRPVAAAIIARAANVEPPYHKAMAMIHDDNTRLSYDIAAWILAGVSLLLILSLHLLPALLAGLLVYELVHILAPRLQVVRIHQEYGKLIAVAMLATMVVL